MICFPWSAVAVFIYIYALVLTYSLSRTHPRWKCLYSGRTCTITIVVATVLIVLYGFVGFHRTWFYYVIMLALLSTMGLSLIDDLWHIRQRRPAMTLAHLSVFVVLATGLFGSGDKRSAYLDAHLGSPVSEAVDVDGRAVHLPFVLTLDSFTIDHYPPKVMLSGGESPEGLDIDREGATAVLDGWHLTVLETYDMAMPQGGVFREINHVGAEPAALVRAEDPGSGQSVEGWISCGSFLFDPARLSLPDGRQLYMPQPMPKKYESKVRATDVKGRDYVFDIAVNHPARIGRWRIYQADYDTERGRWSTLSVLQCVYDPWFPVIRIGLWMVLAAALLMFVTAGAGKKRAER